LDIENSDHSYGSEQLVSSLIVHIKMSEIGIIFVLIPIMYSKLTETEIEFMKLERASERKIWL